jgi:hypothetical protein
MAFVAALALPACSPDLTGMPAPREPEPRQGNVASADAATSEAVARAVRADAATLWRRSDEGAGLTVRTESVTWRDGALGCPSADRMYTQALVPGWRIVVTDGSRSATYHASRSGRWLLCPPERAQEPLPGDATR